MTSGEQRNALALSDIERRDMQAPALKLQRVEARCRKASLTLYPPVGEGGENELGLTILCSAGEFDSL